MIHNVRTKYFEINTPERAEMTQWCIEQFGKEAFFATYGQIPRPDPIPGGSKYRAVLVWSFWKKEDSVLFEMTWQ